MESPQKNVLFRGDGFPSLSTTLAPYPRNTKDPKGYYRLLGVRPWASFEEIKERYRELVKVYHPDGRSPSREKFDEISRAYRVLSENREVYNQTPEDAVFIDVGESTPDGIVEIRTVQESRPIRKEFTGYSFYYKGEPDTRLANVWYNSLLPCLKEFGYRKRVALVLGDQLGVRGRFFLVPYEEPTEAGLFLLGLQSCIS